MTLSCLSDKISCQVGLMGSQIREENARLKAANDATNTYCSQPAAFWNPFCMEWSFGGH